MPLSVTKRIMFLKWNSWLFLYQGPGGNASRSWYYRNSFCTYSCQGIL